MGEEGLSEVLIHLHSVDTTSTLGLGYSHLNNGSGSLNTTDWSNSTTDSDGANGPEVMPSDPWIVTLKALATVTIMVLAVSGNILVITSVFKFEKLRIIANSFIVSLAFADLLVAILVMPFSASQEIAGRWVFGKEMCNIFNANDVLFSTASLLHLCCISMDRYIAITDPFQYETKMTRRRVGVMLLCAWGASALISHIPIHLGWYTTKEQLQEQDSVICSFLVNKIYAVLSSFISFWTPTIIMVFTYVKIFREARRQEKQIYLLAKQSAPSLEQLSTKNHITANGSSGSANPAERNGSSGLPQNRRLTQDRKKMKREHKAAKTLGVIMGAFLCCWLPFFLVYLTSALCDHCNVPKTLVSVLFWIGYLNSALNPIIYAFFNRDFRLAFKRLLRCHRLRLCRRRGPEANALAQYPQPVSGRIARSSAGGRGSGGEYDNSSTPSPRSKRFYDTVDQPSL